MLGEEENKQGIRRERERKEVGKFEQQGNNDINNIKWGKGDSITDKGLNFNKKQLTGLRVGKGRRKIGSNQMVSLPIYFYLKSFPAKTLEIITQFGHPNPNNGFKCNIFCSISSYHGTFMKLRYIFTIFSCYAVLLKQLGEEGSK